MARTTLKIAMALGLSALSLAPSVAYAGIYVEVAPPVHDAEVGAVPEHGPAAGLAVGHPGLGLEDGPRLPDDGVPLGVGEPAPARPVEGVHPVKRVPTFEGHGGAGHRRPRYRGAPGI